MATHLLQLSDFSREELLAYIDRAIALKQETAAGIRHTNLAGKTIALIFEKASTRTRVSFEAAMYGLGGQVIFLSAKETQLARSEPLKDTAMVMSRYVDGLVVRTFSQERVTELARYATIPVINALTDLFHPCQVLSDLMTVIEHKGRLDDLKIAWIGDGNNMANSWVQAAARFGFELVLACPQGYEPAPAILKAAQQEAEGRIRVVRDPVGAVRDAHVINTDVWASMGQESEQQERQQAFQAFQVDAKLLSHARPDCIVLHCLPAHRGEEISEEVLEGEQCVAFDQAENKLHIHKAILEKHIV
ncbi:MAG: ornithine carbamoyltransferase [Deltaproteobacteria bacterium]|jgi:ornithine carbamoyltransferase|nr:ornithine carbamoyltransferase [Deltaproteobacteria bacterium]